MIHQVANESGKPNEVFATMAMLQAAHVLLRQDGVIAFVRRALRVYVGQLCIIPVRGQHARCRQALMNV